MYIVYVDFGRILISLLFAFESCLMCAIGVQALEKHVLLEKFFQLGA